MIDALRRRVIRGLIALPIASSRLQHLFADEHRATASRDWALQSVRLLNTLQAYHNRVYKRYASVQELMAWEVTSRFLDSKTAKRARIDRRFYRELHLERTRILTGWQYAMHLSTENEAYVLVVAASNPPRDVWLYATDQKGLIYEADSTPAVLPSEYVQIDDLPIELHPLGTIEPAQPLAKWKEALLRVGYSTVHVNPRYNCCACTCSMSPQCYCYNVGCSNCGWCCSLTCSDCYICNGNPQCTCC